MNTINNIEYWKEIVDKIIIWRYRKRIKGTTHLEKLQTIIEELDKEFIITKRNKEKEDSRE